MLKVASTPLTPYPRLTIQGVPVKAWIEHSPWRLPPDHPHQAQFRESYAALLDRLGRTDEASELRTQAEAIRQRREQGSQLPPSLQSP
jgi:hypothetical protein